MAKKGGFKFTDKRHAVKGIISAVLGIVSITIGIVLVYISYSRKGNGGLPLGSIGLTAAIISLVGLICGLSSFKEEDAYYLFSKVGTIMNSIILLVWIGIYLIGMGTGALL